MNRILGILFVFGLPLFAGCAGSAETAAAMLRPGGTPDVVLLAVSGHEGVPMPPNDCDFMSNRGYLNDAGDAVDALEDYLGNELGVSGIIESYSSRLESADLDGDGDPDEDRLGFLQLLEDLQFIKDNWIKDYVNPTAIIIVAHGHGAVWAHAAISMKPDVPIAYLITLDGHCEDWDCVHEAEVDAYQTANGDPFDWDLSKPCERWSVVGQAELMDTQNVAFDNVIYNLEVRSDDDLDTIDNFRLDGTKTEIHRFVSLAEDTDDIHLSNSDAMEWVVDFIRNVEGG